MKISNAQNIVRFLAGIGALSGAKVAPITAAKGAVDAADAARSLAASLKINPNLEGRLKEEVEALLNEGDAHSALVFQMFEYSVPSLHEIVAADRDPVKIHKAMLQKVEALQKPEYKNTGAKHAFEAIALKVLSELKADREFFRECESIILDELLQRTSRIVELIDRRSLSEAEQQSLRNVIGSVAQID
jgi:hypothetical protein